LGAIYAEQGIEALAVEALNAAMALGVADYMLWLAKLRLAICRSDRGAAQAALTGLEPFDVPGNAVHRRTWIVEGRVEHALQRGRGEEALAFAERAEHLSQHMLARDRVTPMALLSRSLASVGQHEDAMHAARQATDRASAFRLPFDVIQAWLAYGEASQAVGDMVGLKKSIGVCRPLVEQMRITAESIHARRLSALLRHADGA